jgi:hypothetical protein
MWAMCYSPEQARHTSAPNPSNTLLIRRDVNSGRQAIIEKRDRSACKQCVTLLSRPGITRTYARSEQYIAYS